ncbi:GNAT family N-acetyltransferase [Arthrobacter sp. NicSoilB8]|uniref:GNAT family N-acetyltransferase n=1 Tax=Arthrobacter sp. NicSoilB8 TaxID=2830998 RepID=UPI001CC49192|nr:GNAT family N-acetyltransferase [Arthrobacter sp. NicSoilB8]BCW71485.1 N-acetyltransferase [Arthrobacter sp. NicSoilB8]
MILVGRDTPEREDVLQLLAGHLADMYATSPPESVHALDPAALAGPDIRFWTAREDFRLLGCAALKHLGPGLGEIKSMRTSERARGRGVATALLSRLLTEARTSGYRRLFLETGSQEFFVPARRLYERHGFTPCPPFAGYELDPNSVFMALELDAG